MKKQLLTLVVLGLALYGVSQNTLQNVIKGDNGTTKHFVKLLQKEQLPFNAGEASKILGLSAQSALVLKSTEKDHLGFVHYRFQQTYLGIPVNRSMYVISTKNSKIVSLSGSIITDFSNDMAVKNAAKIDAKQAIAFALSHVGAATYMWQNKAMEAVLKAQLKNAMASYYPVAEKCWYYKSDEIDPSDLTLAYRIDVFAEEPYSRAYYFIDATTGKVIGREERIETIDVTGTANTLYSGTQTIHSEQTGANAYRLHDLSRGNGIITLQAKGAEFTNNSANWNLALPEQNALDAHWGVEMTYDFYKVNFNRNSVDNNGFALYSYVNKGGLLYTSNASWNGSAMNYGKVSGTQKGVTGIDVTGHELTHGVTQYTSGLVYQNEPGAINESMSDIMGKSVQFFAKPSDIDWRLSNDMDWFIRDMANPNAYQQPDTYKGTYWKTGTGDNGGVHTNSGVGNFMFYLLVTGGSGTNDKGFAYNVQGIGLPAADQILYRSGAVYLTSNSQYIDWRNACINAATDLYGASSTEVQQVKNAWDAVGVTGGSGPGPVYCESKGQSAATEYINKVVFGSINNISGNNGGYADFTALSTNVTAGQAYTLQLQAGFTGAARREVFTIWIDFNGDGDFKDSGEKLGAVAATSAAVVNKSITIKAGAKTGATRMRIQMHYNKAIGNSCAVFDLGEVEDYTLNIAQAAAPSNPEGVLISNLSASPNPVVSSLVQLNYTLAKAGNISFQLTDANGLVKGNYKAGLQNKGTNTYKLNNLSALRNGTYYVVVKQDDTVIGRLTVLIAH